MDPQTVSKLSTRDILDVLSGASGKHWVSTAKAVEDNEVDGESLVKHMDSAKTLQIFFEESLCCPITPFVAQQLLHKLSSATPRSAGGAGANGGGGSGNIRLASVVEDMVPLHVQFARTSDGGESKSQWITVEVPLCATVVIVKRALIDYMQFPLSASLWITHNGVELEDRDESPIDWATTNKIRAVLLTEKTMLGKTNLHTHPCIASQVVRQSDSCSVETRTFGSDPCTDTYLAIVYGIVILYQCWYWYW